MTGHVLKENLTKDESFMVMCLHWLSKRYSNKQYELVSHSEEVSNTGMYGTDKEFIVILTNKDGKRFRFVFFMNGEDYDLYDHFDLTNDFDRLLNNHCKGKWRGQTIHSFTLKEKRVGENILKNV